MSPTSPRLPPAPVEHTIRTLVARFSRAPADEITAAFRFGAPGGWGSLAALQLLAAVEAEYAVSLDLPVYLKIATVAELVEHVRCRLGERGADDGAGEP